MKLRMKILILLGSLLLLVFALNLGVASAHSPTGDSMVLANSPADPAFDGLITTALGNGADVGTAIDNIVGQQPNCVAYTGHSEP